MEPQDKDIKKIVEKHQVYVDFEQLWQDLEPHVPQERKRRWSAIWVLGIITLLILLGILFYYEKNTPKEKQESIVSSIIKEIDSKPIQREKKLEGKSKIGTIVSLTNHGNKEILKSSSRVKNEVPGKAVDDPNLLSKAVANPNIYTDDETPTHLNSIMGKAVLNEPNFSVNNLQGELANEMQSNEIKEIHRDRAVIENINPLSSRKFTLTSSENKPNIVAISPVLSIPICEINRFKPVISGFLGMGSFSTNQEVQGKPLEFLNTGVVIGIRLSERWSVSSGLEYSRFATRLQHLQRAYNPVSSNGIIEKIIDENGNTQSINGELTSTEITTSNIKWHTIHNNFDMPLILKYKMFAHKKHSVELYGGPSLMIYSFSQGAYLNSENSLVKFNSDTSPYRYNRWSVNMGINWKWKCFNTSGLELGLHHERRSMTINTLPYSDGISFAPYYITFGYFKNL